MPRVLAVVFFILITSTPVARLKAEQTGEEALCPGIAVTLFEHLIPNEARRYPFEHALLKPFVELWQSGTRPALPVRPERVTVYAVPGHPFLVGYQSGGCVIASLAIERDRLVQWLGPRIGWTI